MDGKSENTSPHVKNVSTSVMVKSEPERRPRVRTETRQAAFKTNAIPIASSRPVRSETQPQKIRLAPFASAFIEVANVSAAVAMPHDSAIGPAFAVTRRPPVAMHTKAKYRK